MGPEGASVTTIGYSTSRFLIALIDSKIPAGMARRHPDEAGPGARLDPRLPTPGLLSNRC